MAVSRFVFEASLNDWFPSAIAALIDSLRVWLAKIVLSLGYLMTDPAKMPRALQSLPVTRTTIADSNLQGGRAP